MKPTVTAWQRMQGCESNACVEIAKVGEDDEVWLRSSRDLDTIVKLSYPEWDALTRALASGKY